MTTTPTLLFRQARVFVPSSEPMSDWYPNLLGRVVVPLLAQHRSSLSWYWFTRYVDTVPGDTGDCDFNVIPSSFKSAPQELLAAGFLPVTPYHRSVRFRFAVLGADQSVFETALDTLIKSHGYAYSSVLDFPLSDELGGSRFLGNEHRKSKSSPSRATLVVDYLHALSELVLDTLVGPLPQNRFQFEYNDDKENPLGSTFESIHHLFCNSTDVPLRVHVHQGQLWTDWMKPVSVVGQARVHF